MFDKLRQTTLDPDSITSAARAAGLDEAELQALARETRKLIVEIGGGERYAALSGFLDEIARNPCYRTD